MIALMGIPVLAPQLHRLSQVDVPSRVLFKLIYLGPLLEMFDPVQYTVHTSIDKRAAGLRLKGLLVKITIENISNSYTLRFIKLFRF